MSPRRRKKRGRSVSSPRDTKHLDLYYFDKKTADEAVEFIESYLRHWQGEFAGRLFILQPWQKTFIRNVFGWKKRADGLRRYRSAYVEIPKKNGKSFLVAAVALLLLLWEREPGGEIYSVAGDRKQASIIFEDAKAMIRQDDDLGQFTRIYAKKLIGTASLSTYEPLSSEVVTKHGFNPSAILFDELHIQKARELWDTLRLGIVTRRQPLTISITTAGVYDPELLCWVEHEYAKACLLPSDDAGHIDDPTHFVMIYALDPEAGDNWQNPKHWKRANPNLGVTIKHEALAAIVRSASKKTEEQSKVKQLHFNIWGQTHEGGIDMDLWREKNARDPIIADGAPCYVGVDLSSKLDLTAVVAMFPHDDGTFSVLPQFWIPEENMEERRRRDVFDYPRYVEAGLINATPGNWVKQELVREYVRELRDRFTIVKLGFDPWSAAVFAPWMDEDDIEAEEVRQGFRTMSEPSKYLVGLIRDGRVRHGNHPVLTWNAANTVFKRDNTPATNWKPVKDKRGVKRIDGIIGMIEAIYVGEIMVPEDDEGGEVWAM